MAATRLSSEWSVEWATVKPNGEGCFDIFVLDQEQAVEYGDELVMSLRVDGPILRNREINPEEPFAWRIEDGELLTKQISRKTFEKVAESDRDDAGYAQRVLEHRATRRLQNVQE
jgi:hypothetical protein